MPVVVVENAEEGAGEGRELDGGTKPPERLDVMVMGRFAVVR